MTFKERTELGLENLIKQNPTTLEKAKAQAIWLKENSISKNKKK